MIGQQHLQSQIEQLIDNGTFPRFSIFIGPRGSGKKTLLLEMFEGIYLEDNKVDSVRKMIEMVYKVGNRTFIMPDADTMSNAAKNALLKVIEECPNDNYFIMTLEDENNTLETIRSRGTVFHMDRYTPDEIFEYYWSLEGSELMPHGMPNDAELVRELCETPGDVQILVKMGVQEFYDYAQLVVDNIADVSLANSFKIPSKVALKDDVEGYDLRLFWKAFIRICFERSFDDMEDKFEECKHSVSYMCAAQVTSSYLQQLRVKGINKQMLMDNWIIDVREVLNEAV